MKNLEHRAEWLANFGMLESARDMRQAIDRIKTLEARLAAEWMPMKSAPKTGQVILIMMEGADIGYPARWITGQGDLHATMTTEGPGWYMVWDGWEITDAVSWKHLP